MKKTILSSRNGAPVQGNRAYSQAAIASTLGLEGRFSAEAAVDNRGNLNGDSRRDLVQGLALIASAASAFETFEAESGVQEATAAEIRASVQAAFAGAAQNDSDWVAVGEALVTQVNQTAGRTGYGRRVLQYATIGKGEVPRVRYRERDTDVLFLTNGGTTVASMPRQQFAYPEFYSLSVAVNVPEQEIMQDTGDILGDRYNDCLEQVMVGEDRNVKKLSEATANAGINPRVFFPSLTPGVFVTMQTEVEKWGGLPVSNAVMAIDLWNDVKTDSEFLAWFSEIEKHAIASTGRLGNIGGVEVITDGYRLPRFQVLNAGEIFMYAHPEQVGVIMQQGEMQVNATNQYNSGRNERGWLISTFQAMTLPNAYGVIKGQKT